MSNDRFTEVTRESWFSRIGNAFKGVLVGLALLTAAFPLLFWNEGRAVKRHKTLQEGSGQVVSVAADRVDPAAEGRLVHVTGRAETEAVLQDADFGVSAPALKLKRRVEMYQWDERVQSTTQKKLGGGTETVKTYTYEKVWAEGAVDASRFRHPEGHQNPAAPAYASAEFTAAPVTLGAFTLPPALVNKIGGFESLAVGEALQPESRPARARLDGNGFYVGADPAAPQVGDLRVTFSVARPTAVSVIARQTGASFAPYQTRAGGTIELLQTGTHTSDAMILKAQQDNALLAWLLRLGGFLLMLVGLSLILRPLAVLADVVPLVGTLVGAGTGLVAAGLAALLALATIAVAWLAYRPLLGGALLAAAALVTAALARRVSAARRDPAR